MKKVRTLVVDDSRTMRTLICHALGRDPDIEVVGQAANALEAREAIKTLDPDVVTLDVEMPNMNGIEFLTKIMQLRPTPVIMVSNLTSQGTAATIKALEIGAFDCVAKPSPGEHEIFADLPAKVKEAAGARQSLGQPLGQSLGQPLAQSLGQPLGKSVPRDAREASPPAGADYVPNGKIVAIGASTGGVEALIAVLARFPKNCPPTVVTQHMPATFTRSFADRLDRLCAPSVREASNGAPLLPGHIYLAPGTISHLEVISGKMLTCHLSAAGIVNGHRPAIDVLFNSVAATARDKAVGVILTGMGRDGADGLAAMRQAGARTIGQDETSLVYGMPRVAFERGAVEKQLPLDKIGNEILRLTNRIEEGSRPCRSHLP